MSDSYFQDGAAESSAIFEALQELSQECGPKEPVEAKSEIPPVPAPPSLPRLRHDVAVWTYFFQAGDAIKIGRSTNPRGRTAAFRTASHHEVVLLCYVPEELASERDMHREFAAIHIRGEWFKAAPELHQRIVELREEWRRTQKNYRPRAPVDRAIPADTIGRLMWLARNTYRDQPIMRDYLELLREQTIALKRAQSDAERAAAKQGMERTGRLIEHLKQNGALPSPTQRVAPQDIARIFELT